MVKVLDLLRCSPIRHHRQIHRQHTRRVERRLRLLEHIQRPHQDSRSGEQQERGRDLHDGEDAQPPAAAPRHSRSAARERCAQRRAPRRQPRNERQEHRRRQRQRNAKPHQVEIELQPIGTHREPRGIAPQHRHHRPREDQRRQHSASAQHQAFRQQRTPQRRGVSSQRRAHRQLRFAANRSREHQVGHIRARNHKQQPRGRKQHPQNRIGARIDLVVHPRHIDPVMIGGLVDLRMRAEYRRVPRAQLRSCASRVAPGASRAKTSVMRCSRPVTIVADRWCGLVTTLAMISVATGYGTDGSRTPTIVAERAPLATLQPHRLSNHAWVGVQRLAPESIRQHDRARRIRPIVGRSQQPTQHRAQPHHLEVMAVHHACGNLARRAEPDDREVDRRECPQFRDRLQPLAKVIDLGD